MSQTRKSSTPSYEALTAELEAVMAELQREDVDIDVALAQYKRGLELIQQLEHYLASAENTVQELKAKFNTASK